MLLDEEGAAGEGPAAGEPGELIGVSGLGKGSGGQEEKGNEEAEPHMGNSIGRRESEGIGEKRHPFSG